MMTKTSPFQLCMSTLRIGESFEDHGGVDNRREAEMRIFCDVEIGQMLRRRRQAISLTSTTGNNNNNIV